MLKIVRHHISSWAPPRPPKRAGYPTNNGEPQSGCAVVFTAQSFAA
ncbi:MAG: hypothetical protein ORN98_00410 [Alphaproteobacteria bacterium]|nr:hypothetical protein [Alphaproteobacteria bacterium]